MSNPTRFTSGVSTAYSGEVFYSYPYPDPFHTGSTQSMGSTSYMNDFNTLIGTDYIVTGTSSTFLLADGIGGQAVLTPGGTTTEPLLTSVGLLSSLSLVTVFGLQLVSKYLLFLELNLSTLVCKLVQQLLMVFGLAKLLQALLLT